MPVVQEFDYNKRLLVILIKNKHKQKKRTRRALRYRLPVALVQVPFDRLQFFQQLYRVDHIENR
jgi:hypothetical protein